MFSACSILSKKFYLLVFHDTPAIKEEEQRKGERKK